MNNSMHKLWKTCSMSSFSQDTGSTFKDYPCQVRIGEARLDLFYFDEELGKEVCYTGSEMGEGHYSLICAELGGKGNLHRFPKGRILDGWWSEGGEEGMWRITIDD